MHGSFARRFTLAKRATDALGLVCDGEGLTLGPAPLIVAVRDPAGDRRFRMAKPAWIADVLAAAYGDRFDAALTRRLAQLDGIAKALGDGRLAEAAIRAVHLGLPALTAEAAARLTLLRKYSPDQPRDWHGRWTSGGHRKAGENYGDGQSNNTSIVGRERRTECIEHCYHLLERPKPYRWHDGNPNDFWKCVNDCERALD